MIEKKRIAKNTLYMYFRMILVMLVNIYTSRVVLDKLGVEDYGLYQAVTAAVSVISFITVALNTSTSRFLTFELGRNDFVKLKRLFSTIFYIYIIISIIALIVLETVGLWYMETKFVIPPGREYAVAIVYQLAILMVIQMFMEVPYGSTFVAHERFSFYAYISILDVVLMLGLVYLLSLSTMDKLVFYTILMAIERFIMIAIKVTASMHYYPETHLTKVFDKEVFKSMFGFTSWTLVANVSNTIMVQGSVLLMNLFFSPAMIAAKSLASQINTAISQFVGNFRSAVNPQIIKSYASGEHGDSQALLLQSTVFSFDLMLVMGLPCAFTIKTILSLWLIEVPTYAAEFTQLVILTSIFSVIDSSFYTTFVASGKLKTMSMYGMCSSILYFVILYVIYKSGGNVLWVQYLYIINTLVWSFAIKPYLMCKQMNYKCADISRCLISCLKVFLGAIIPSVLLSRFIGESTGAQIGLFVAVFLISLSSAVIFMEKSVKDKIFQIIKTKIRK
jgi:O-antigen/teichoic acid export membrane protein